MTTLSRSRSTSNPVSEDWVARVRARLGGAGGKCFCPVHENPNTSKPSLSVSVGADGKPLLYCHGNCSQDQLVEKFKEMGLWPTTGRAKPSHTERTTPSPDEIYDRADDDRERIATYLAGRGIETVPKHARLLSAAEAGRVGWHRYPCMVLPLVNVEGDLEGVHLTYLETDCSAKADVEKQRQRIGKGKGVFASLKAAKQDRPLIIGEGIESTLSAAQIAGGLPCIAALSTGNMKNLESIPACSEIIIAADNDSGGLRAAEDLAQRLANRYRDRKVRIAVPPHDGDDWNDVLVAGRRLDDMKDAILRARVVKPNGDNGKPYEMVRASDVVIRPLEWLWPGHLLRGAQELLTGSKGVGKSQTQCALAACVTACRTWPDGQPKLREPGNVIMVTSEDTLDQTIVPRLMAAGADLDRVFFLRKIKKDRKSRSFLLGEDIDALEEMIVDTGAAMVMIDPITQFMGRVDSHSATDVRGQLGPLTELAERTNVAISTVTHPPKDGGQKAINNFVGSQAFITSARIGHMALPETRTTPEGFPVPTGRYLFTMVASNHEKKPAIAYRIETQLVRQAVPPGDREAALRARALGTHAAYIEWEEVVEVTADDALASSRKGAAAHPADAFLRDALKDGPRNARDVEAEGAERGFSSDQLTRAKRRIGVRTRRTSAGAGGGGHWEWEL